MTKTLRQGLTTGSCAAACAKEAVMVLSGQDAPKSVKIPMPDGGREEIYIKRAGIDGARAFAETIKDAGDDPDVTHGTIVRVFAEWADGADVFFAAGEGVGVVTKKGLQIPPGEPAINPAPRKMIIDAVREVSGRGVLITVSIPGGDEIAKKTFNPRLGVEGGLSVLGTSGRVRPYSHPAIIESLKCALNVAVANGVASPVFTAGNIGTRSVTGMFDVEKERVIEVSNEWGVMLDFASSHPLKSLLVAGHPGKLAKLAEGWWNTHSSKSGNAAPFTAALAEKITGRKLDVIDTVEGVFAQLSDEDKEKMADELAALISKAVSGKLKNGAAVAVALFDMQGNYLGGCGDMSEWRRKNV